MFDDYAKSLFADFPEFDGLSREWATRTLSAAYVTIVRRRADRLNGDTGQAGAEQPDLRRLANTLLFHVILREDRPARERQAAAFVAAESIALMADYLAVETEPREKSTIGVRAAERFARAESALLYLFAQYDACATAVLRDSSRLDDEPMLGDQAADWALTRLEQLCRLKPYPLRDREFPFSTGLALSLSVQDLEQDTVARLYGELGAVAVDFLGWLGGLIGDTQLDAAVGRLVAMLEALSPDPGKPNAQPTGYEFCRIFHLATLLRLSWSSLRERAMLHMVTPPSGGDQAAYKTYLQARAVGDGKVGGRPVLWPSAVAYVEECVVGDARHAVVSMPTGSGKSFIGELAVSQAVCDGWALYLAPTNALTEQVRGDLRQGLRELKTEVFAFVGDQEYSVLTADRVVEMPANAVAVMTPEKCALALRLSPEAFEGCRLVVFDECHLLGETGSGRGPLAELVVSQLMLRAPNCRFLLMSAIVQNPKELAKWLESAAGGGAKAVAVRWRPTRTLRTVVGVEAESLQTSWVQAKGELERMPVRRKRQAFVAKCALAASLRGAWQSDDEDDYVIVPLDCEVGLAVTRKRSGADWQYGVDTDGWVNATATNLGRVLVQAGIQTLVFTPANRHYPFTNGRKIAAGRGVSAEWRRAPEVVRACETLAEYELGCTSEVFGLLAKGVAVHTSLMLETEKIASEIMFRNRGAPLMFATGTLAQGLNLPAMAVVIAGSRIGYAKGDERGQVQRRRFAQLLNAAGRAGRAGFANQGLVVAVPDRAVAFRDFDNVLRVRAQVDYLQRNDDAVMVGSGLEKFLDSVCEGALRADAATDVELTVVSLVAGGDEAQLKPGSVLDKTFAAYLRRQAGKADVDDTEVQRLVEFGEKFVENTGAPKWATVAAQRAGLDFFLTAAIIRSWEGVRTAGTDVSGWSVWEWTEELLRVVARIPPGLLGGRLRGERLRVVSSAFETKGDGDRAAVWEVRELKWTPPEWWLSAWRGVAGPLRAWMEGRSLREIAAIVDGVSVEGIGSDRTVGKPIPRVLSVVGETWSALALIAGGFLAVAEQALGGEMPLELTCMPMCVKYGCDSPETLAWFRFGVRLRRPARLLARTFPVPRLGDDEEVRAWVRGTRRAWLSSAAVGYQDREEVAVLAAIRAFVGG